jgi:hypothetical protein
MTFYDDYPRKFYLEESEERKQQVSRLRLV